MRCLNHSATGRALGLGGNLRYLHLLAVSHTCVAGRSCSICADARGSVSNEVLVLGVGLGQWVPSSP